MHKKELLIILVVLLVTFFGFQWWRRIAGIIPTIYCLYILTVIFYITTFPSFIYNSLKKLVAINSGLYFIHHL